MSTCIKCVSGTSLGPEAGSVIVDNTCMGETEHQLKEMEFNRFLYSRTVKRR